MASGRKVSSAVRLLVNDKGVCSNYGTSCGCFSVWEWDYGKERDVKVKIPNGFVGNKENL